MRRVVVTGMGIVSSIGNSAQEVLASLREAKSGIVKADTYAELGFRCQVHGAPKLDWEGMIDRKVRRFMGSRRCLELPRHGAGDPRRRARGERRLQRAHRPDHGLGRSLDKSHRPGRRHHAREGPEEGRPLRGAEVDVLDQLGDAFHALSHQGLELFDLVGLLDLGALHRQRRRADPMGQAGHRVRRRRRGARLDAVGPVRRHERHVVGLQRPARGREPRL